MILLDKVYITHHQIRDEEQIPDMVKFVQHDGRFTQSVLTEYAEKHGHARASQLIQICRFPDGFEFIRDGHHRAVSIYLGDRNFLYPEEYVTTEFKYSDILLPAIDNGWITPFDPRTEVRHTDLSSFRRKYEKAVQDGNDPIEFILENKPLYVMARQYSSIKGLCQTL